MSRRRRRAGFPSPSSCCFWGSAPCCIRATARGRSCKALLAQGDSHADVLSKELEQTNSRVALLRAQLDVTTQKLGLTQAELARARTMAQQIQQDQQSSDAKLVAQIGQVQQENETEDRCRCRPI